MFFLQWNATSLAFTLWSLMSTLLPIRTIGAWSPTTHCKSVYNSTWRRTFSVSRDYGRGFPNFPRTRLYVTALRGQVDPSSNRSHWELQTECGAAMPFLRPDAWPYLFLEHSLPFVYLNLLTLWRAVEGHGSVVSTVLEALGSQWEGGGFQGMGWSLWDRRGPTDMRLGVTCGRDISRRLPRQHPNACSSGKRSVPVGTTLSHGSGSVHSKRGPSEQLVTCSHYLGGSDTPFCGRKVVTFSILQ